MKDSAPILSICIPTFNRSAWLEKTLISIASQAAFYDGEEIEIVISDNQSDDDTQRISEEYSLRFPGKVRYYRNSDQIGAMNFEQALFRGRGDFLKLHNDTLLCVDGCLSEILNIIKATQDEKPVIFFLNSRVEGCESITVCPSLNDFLAHASFMCTWIGAFGIWKTDFQAVGDFSKDLALNLIQTPILFEIISSGKRSIVINRPYFISLTPGRKHGYNIAEVFGENYLSILNRHVASGALSDEVYQVEKKKLLLNHIIPYYFDFFNEHDFKKTGFFKYLKEYRDDDYFYEAIEEIVFKRISIQSSPLA